jgi:hypothetical protein
VTATRAKARWLLGIAPEPLAWCPQDYLAIARILGGLGPLPTSVGHASACHPSGGTVAYGVRLRQLKLFDHG